MSDYTQLTDFSAKDLLTTGDPNKLILGADVDAELAAIATAILSKYDSTDLASQAEAEAGASTSKLMTPQRTEQWGAVWAAENAGMVGDLHGLSSPGADRILFWDQSAGSVAALSASTGLTLSGTTLTVNNSELSITASQISDLSATAAELNLLSGKTSVATLGANIYSARQTVQSVIPNLVLDETDAAANEGKWRFIADAGNLYHQALDDAETGTSTYIQVSRSGVAVTTVNVKNSTLQYNGNEVVSVSNTLTLTNKTLTSPVINTGVSGTAILDEDNMASNSATKLATQQSIKAYVDAQAGGIAFSAVLSSDQTSLGNGPYSFSTSSLANVVDEYDPDGVFTPATGKFQPATAGYYLVGLTAFGSLMSSGDVIAIYIKKNGAGISVQHSVATSGNEGYVDAARLVYLNGSTDYITYEVSSTDTSWTLESAYTQIFGFLARSA